MILCFLRLLLLLLLLGISLPEKCWANLLQTTLFNNQIYNFNLQPNANLVKGFHTGSQDGFWIYCMVSLTKGISQTTLSKRRPELHCLLELDLSFPANATVVPSRRKDGNITMESWIPAVEIALFQLFSCWQLLLLSLFLDFIQRKHCHHSD